VHVFTYILDQKSKYVSWMCMSYMLEKLRSLGVDREGKDLNRGFAVEEQRCWRLCA